MEHHVCIFLFGWKSKYTKVPYGSCRTKMMEMNMDLILETLGSESKSQKGEKGTICLCMWNTFESPKTQWIIIIGKANSGSHPLLSK